jgi:hypothetical protein
VIALSGTGTSAVHSVSLSWSPSASTVTGYNVYVSTVSGGSYTKLTASPVAAANYTDSGLQTAQMRYYVVTAVDSNNTRAPSRIKCPLSFLRPRTSCGREPSRGSRQLSRPGGTRQSKLPGC